jgi:hypothetical protein
VRFKLTEDHLKLLGEVWVETNEDDYAGDGGFSTDPKRPYGNSDIAQDIWGILNSVDGKRIYWDEDKDGEFFEELEEEMLKLHREIHIAAQIVLHTQFFEPGIYEKMIPYDSRSWGRVA